MSSGAPVGLRGGDPAGADPGGLGFIYTLAHEMKTPLTATREFVSIVMDGLAGPLTEQQREYLGIAREGCDRLLVHINDLLEVGRLDTGKLRAELRPGSLAALVQKATAMMAPVAARKGIALRSEVEAGLPEVLMDESRIIQVMANLLSNALHYTTAGGQIVTRLGAGRARPACLEVSISDTGCGISPGELPHVFDRLHQGADPSGGESAGSGLGLGLYIAREFVRLHGGQISVESEPGHGSTFTFTIPLMETKPAIEAGGGT